MERRKGEERCGEEERREKGGVVRRVRREDWRDDLNWGEGAREREGER